MLPLRKLEDKVGGDILLLMHTGQKPEIDEPGHTMG